MFTLPYGVYFGDVKIERLHLPALSGTDIFDPAVNLLAAALALAVVVLAGRWLTELTAPRPVAVLPSAAMAQPDASVPAITRLFASGKVQTQALEGLYLTGVFTGSQGGGFATLRTRSGEVHAFPGDEVSPGIVLKQIEGNRVILSASGMQKELTLQGNTAAAAPSTDTLPNRPPEPGQAAKQ